MGDSTEPATHHSPPGRQLPFREDYWTEDATWTLTEAWGRRFEELNRGNLRQNDWQEVADAVNARHGRTKKTRRTDVQCKNRIDTLKKRYKIEKTKIEKSNGTLKSSWPFYPRLEYLIESSITKLPPSATPYEPSDRLLPYSQAPSSASKKRPAQSRPVEDSNFRRKYSALAEEDAESEGGGAEERGAADVEEGSTGILAKAIERFGEIYEKIELEKQRQMVELEKHRMQFAKDLEVQRMQLFVDTQVQFQKTRRDPTSRSR